MSYQRTKTTKNAYYEDIELKKIKKKRKGNIYSFKWKENITSPPDIPLDNFSNDL